MKLPFDLSLKIVFRVLLPGFIVALALLPLIDPVLQALNIPNYNEAVFIGVALIGGWLVLMLDMPIYMAYEGRRFWPARLRDDCIGLEKKRLAALLAIDQKFLQDRNSVRREDYEEAWFDIRRFPLNNQGRPEARFPTRLGNLVAAFEDYPRTRYGVDSIFLWPRLWLKLDKDLRAELEDSQAQADSALYASFAFYVFAVMYLVFFILRLAGLRGLGWISTAPPLALAGLALIGLAVGYLVYRMDLHPQASFGEKFKAAFDIVYPQMNFAEVLKRVGEITNNGDFSSATSEEQARVAWLYLQYYRVKPPGEPRSIPVPEYLEKKAGQAHPADGAARPGGKEKKP